MRAALLLLSLSSLAACGGDHVIAYGVGGGDTGASGGDTGTSGGDADAGSSADGGSEGGGDPVGPGELVITELMIDPSAVSDDLGEWVELYNDADRTLSLDGLLLGDEGVDAWILADASDIGAGAYAVLCAEASAAHNGGASCDGTFLYSTWGDGFALSNSGDEVVLARQDGTVIDRISYSEGQVSPGVALGLAPGRTDAGDNDSAGAWCQQSSAMSGGDLGTPGEENDGC